MRKLIALAAVAPLALLAACGDSGTTDEAAVTEPMETGLADTPTPASYAPPSDALDTMDYSGSYAFTGMDGSQSTITLNSADNTYTYMAPGMTEARTGTYTMANNRIEVTDLDERGPGYFSVSNDALYRLADDSRAYSDTEGSTIYVRAQADDGQVGSNAPGASVNSVADKRD